MGRKRREVLTVASAALAASVSSAALATLPSVTFDLRVHGTDAKDATVYRTGDAVQLDLYATVAGLDDDPTNDRISLGSGYFRSSSGGLLGDLLGISPPPPFNLSGSTAGLQYDVDADGDSDVGNPTGSSGYGDGFYAFRAFPPPDTQPPQGFFLGRVRFTESGRAGG